MQTRPRRRIPKQEAVVEHSVTLKDGFYEVISGRSGSTYRVVVDGEQILCPCPGYTHRAACSHVEAVKDAIQKASARLLEKAQEPQR